MHWTVRAGTLNTKSLVKLIIACNCSPYVMHYCLYYPQCCACRHTAAVCEKCSVLLWLWGSVGGGAHAPESHRGDGEPRSAAGARLAAGIGKSAGLPAGREGLSVRYACFCTNGETWAFGGLIIGAIIKFNRFNFW